MAEKSFAPHSRQQDEREITRVQKDFSAGTFSDMPASSIPDNGVAYLNNMIDYGGYLEGRKGTRWWGNYSSNSPSLSVPPGSNPLGAYFHKVKKKIVVQVGTYIMVSDTINATSWSTAVNISASTLYPTESTFDEYNNYVIIFNVNGIFKLDLDSPYYCMVRMNEVCPSNIYIGIVQSDDIYPEGQPRLWDVNYTCTYSYIRGKTSLLDDRLSPHTNLVLESGNFSSCYNIKTNKIVYDDHGSFGFHRQDDTSDPYVGEYYGIRFDIEKDSSSTSSFGRQWNTVSIYRTLVTDYKNSTEKKYTGNDPELYVWERDVPLAFPLELTYVPDDQDFDGDDSFKVENCTVDKSIIGMDVRVLYVPSDDPQIGDFGFFGTSYEKIKDVVNNKISIGNITGVLPFDLEQIPARLNCANTGMAICTITSGDYLTNVKGRPLPQVGEPIFLSDGNVVFIKTRTSDSMARLTYPVPIDGDYAVCWDVRNTTIFSTPETELVLKSRISSMPLVQRFYKPLPSSDIGKVTGGFVFSVSLDKNHIQYSPIPEGYDYIAGYYHPAYQDIFVKDKVEAFGEVPDKLAVFCNNGTYTLPLNTIQEYKLPNIGVSIPYIPGIVKVDDTIGCFDRNSIQSIGKNRLLLLTSEKVFRLFDGQGFSDDLSHGKINTILQKISMIYSIYNHKFGYFFITDMGSFLLGLSGIDNTGAVLPNYTQGIGFTEITTDANGYDVQLNGNCMINIYDGTDVFRSIFIEHTNNRFLELFNNMVVSSCSYVEQVPYNYRDFVAYNGTTLAAGSVAVKTRVKFKEDTSEYEKYMTEHLSTRYYIRPLSKEIGYPVTPEAISKVYVDDDVVEEDKTELLNNDSEVVYIKKIEGRRIQSEVSFNTAILRIVGRQSDYIAKSIRYNLEYRPSTGGINQAGIQSRLVARFCRGNYTKSNTYEITPVVS